MSDLDVFTTPELEQQAQRLYEGGVALMDRLPDLGHWGAESRIVREAADEQFALMRACHVELARRFAENGSISHA